MAAPPVPLLLSAGGASVGKLVELSLAGARDRRVSAWHIAPLHDHNMIRLRAAAHQRLRAEMGGRGSCIGSRWGLTCHLSSPLCLLPSLLAFSWMLLRVIQAQVSMAA